MVALEKKGRKITKVNRTHSLRMSNDKPSISSDRSVWTKLLNATFVLFSPPFRMISDTYITLWCFESIKPQKKQLDSNKI